MPDNSYKEEWNRKVKEASKLGRKRVKELLEKNSKFRERWIKNCRKGPFGPLIAREGFEPPTPGL